MIKVIHFDYDKFISGAIRDRLEFEFNKYPQVEYYDFMLDHSSGTFYLRTLESLLPDYDVLLIHPGVERQGKALTYSELFPKLRVALLIPGDFSHYHYEEIGDTKLFGYAQVGSIVNFVLQEDSLR